MGLQPHRLILRLYSFRVSVMSQDSRFSLNRRHVLAGLAGTAGATLTACGDSSGVASAMLSPTPPAPAPTPPGMPSPTPTPAGGISPAPQPPVGKTLPKPEDSGIDHIVVVMMENRTFDHMLGWVPGADGIQAGLKFKNIEGKEVETFRLSADPLYGFGGCGFADPDHGYAGGRTHYNKGAMDGWLLTDDTKLNPADKFPLGYYTAEDLPFFKGVADHWTVCDKYFSGILSSTYPNRFYMHSGETDRLTNTFDISSLPTIWDRLAAKGLSGKYFFNDLPLLGLWGQKYVQGNVVAPYATFLAMAAAGQLPALSYVEPRFLGENPGEQGVPPGGVSNDDHPVADVRDGQAFLNTIYDALRNSPQWNKTLFIIVYDEWGGFYDHVVPPVGPVSAAEKALGNDGRLGFRVPCLIMGPRAKKGVSKLQFDPQSILNLVTWRFGLEPVGSRAAWSLNMAYALDFDAPPRTDKPAFTVGAGPFGTLCTNSTLDGIIPRSASSKPAESHFGEWLVLKSIARKNGFEV